MCDAGNVMSKSAFLGKFDRHVMVVKTCAFAAVLGIWVSTAHAAETSKSFNITVNLQTGIEVPDAGMCTMIGAFGTSVTVSCAPGSFRFITHPPAADALQDKEPSYTGAGTVTSWRMIRLENGDYLEMTVQW
jgi:hypothetical protein